MGRKSTFDRIDAKRRAAIDRLLTSPELTLDEVVQAAEDLGVTVSRSAAGRRRQSLGQLARRVRETEEVARAFATELGSDLADETGRHLVQILHSLIFRFAAERGGDEDGADAKELRALSAALRDLQAAKTLSTTRELTLRREVAKLAAERAADAAQAAAGQAGFVLSAEALAAIRRDVYGVAE